MEQVVWVVYVPTDHVDAVLSAMFEAGAGHVGGYEGCAWKVLGNGQFLPGATSQPFLGQPGVAMQVPEYRVEVVCPLDRVPSVLAAMQAAHPYETPAYHLLRSLNPALIDQELAHA